MSRAEILAALPHLSREDLAEIQAKLDQLAGDAWQDGGELSEADRQALDAGIASYKASPNAGSPWEQVKARIQAGRRS